MPVKTYDPSSVTVTVGGFDISGFADGTAVTIVRDEPAWTFGS